MYLNAQGILENIRNFSKKAVVHITMDGDFHVVSDAGLSKVGVAFPAFDVFLADGSPTHIARSTQYVFVQQIMTFDCVHLKLTWCCSAGKWQAWKKGFKKQPINTEPCLCKLKWSNSCKSSRVYIILTQRESYAGFLKI